MSGLSTAEAARRLKKYGPNDLATEHRLPGMMAFLSRFKNPLVIILVLAGGLSAFLGQVDSFIIITAIVLVSVILDFVNTYRSERAAQALKERVRVLAEVRRSGAWVAVPLAHLVPGDVVKLEAGKIVPADGRIVESNALYVNEASLTGESFPQPKPTAAGLYLGSSVTSGSGLMEVTATGHKTKYARIAQVLAHKEPPTEFDREIREFSLLIVKVTTALVIFIFAFNSIFRHSILESLLFSLALAVGLTPELLPLIITLNLTKGSLAMAKHGVIVKKLSAIQNFGSMDVLCTDKTGTLTEDRIVLVKYVDGLGAVADDVLLHGYVSSMFSTAFENPLDRAIKEFRHLSTEGYDKVCEIPFDFERKRESVVVKHGRKRLMITKGAPEEILRIADQYREEQSMSPSMRKCIQGEYEQLSNDGFRVLAIATRELGSQETYTATDEARMTFRGFVAFLDPAKQSVASTLRRMHEHGIEVKIITGDNPLVTRRIAQEIELDVKGLVSGAELEGLNDLELGELVERTTIFARVNPEQKMAIIQALQRNGHVVGYMGDGINDAPSLRMADIGVSVNNAVDVAKDTADFILLHKSLADLINGVLEGRRTYANTLKYLMMSLGSNFGNMFSVAGGSLFLPFLPMAATQILFNNLLYDTSQFALPTDSVDAETLQKPRRLDVKALRRAMLVFGPLSSLFDFATFGVLLYGFHLGAASFQTGWFLESLVTQTLVIYIIRTKRIPFIQSWPSPYLLLGTLGTITIGAVVALTGLGRFFAFGPLPSPVLLLIAVIVALYLVLAEVVKREFYRRVAL